MGENTIFVKKLKKGLFKLKEMCYGISSWLNTVLNKGVLNLIECAFFARKN